MNLFSLLFVVIITSPLSFSEDQFEDDRLDREQIKMIQERIEEAPSSTTVGGARSGALEKEKKADDKEKTIAPESRLYQSKGYYRKGF